MPTNMAFHDLTKNKQAPPAAKSLLGLGSKFIVTPDTTTGSLESTMTRIRRDFSLAVFFASGNDEFLDECAYDQFKSRSKLYVKSKFTPKETDHASEAKPEIWTNWADFSAKGMALKTAAEQLDPASLDGINAGMGAIGGSCKACHSVYRM